MVYGCVGGKHACVDLTMVSQLVEFGFRAFTIGHAVIKKLRQANWSNKINR